MPDDSAKHILVADSCACGLGVLHRIQERLPDAQLTYLADGEKNPFGLRTESEIRRIVNDWIAFGYDRDRPPADALVIACNTASVAMGKKMSTIRRSSGVKMVTMLDGVRYCLHEHRDVVKGRGVAVFGTRLLLKTGVYQKLLIEAGVAKVYEIVGTATERLVARGLFDDASALAAAEEELNRQFDPSVDTILLGCTCFAFARKLIQKNWGQGTILLDPSDSVADKVANLFLGGVCERHLGDLNFSIVTTGDLSQWKQPIADIAESLLMRPYVLRSVTIR